MAHRTRAYPALRKLTPNIFDRCRAQPGRDCRCKPAPGTACCLRLRVCAHAPPGPGRPRRTPGWNPAERQHGAAPALARARATPDRLARSQPQRLCSCAPPACAGPRRGRDRARGRHRHRQSSMAGGSCGARNEQHAAQGDPRAAARTRRVRGQPCPTGRAAGADHRYEQADGKTTRSSDLAARHPAPAGRCARSHT